MGSTTYMCESASKFVLWLLISQITIRHRNPPGYRNWNACLLFEWTVLKNLRVVSQNLLCPNSHIDFVCTFLTQKWKTCTRESHTQKSSFLGEISDNGIVARHVNISTDAFRCEREVKYHQSLSLILWSQHCIF